jgi:hypothetical protein
MGVVGATGLVPSATAQDDTDDFKTIDVPGAEPTIQDGVDAATEGDLVLVEAGTYGEAVEVETPGITVRGVDRNEVVLDGEFERKHGVVVEADGVAIENLTARHFTGNAFYWRDVVGFRASYLTAYNDGYYGIYAYGSRDGRFEHSYASGHPDAGFYLGRNGPFEAVISDVIAEYNTLGYSGTSTGADLTIRDSVWRYNMAGIVPNTLDEVDPPQRASRVVGNEVYANDYRDAPNTELTYPFYGMGILVWGGNDNLIEDNDVRDHEHFGIVAQRNVDEPSGNVVRDNGVRGSGTADLALGEPAGAGNRFVDNEFERSLPASIEADASGGSSQVTAVFEELESLAESGNFPAGDWRDQPEPDDQPTMPDPEAPPRPARKSVSWD